MIVERDTFCPVLGICMSTQCDADSYLGKKFPSFMFGRNEISEFKGQRPVEPLERGAHSL